MKFRGPLRKNLLSSCAAVGPDDGTDPRYDRSHRPVKVPNRKALQLCGEVQQTLSLVLADCGEDCLRGLEVTGVIPAPDSTRLLVSLAALPSASLEDHSAVMAALERASPFLRSEVAAAIHRKKVPELVLRVVD
jgi:ribosome-binding factor A